MMKYSEETIEQIKKDALRSFFELEDELEKKAVKTSDRTDVVVSFRGYDFPQLTFYRALWSKNEKRFTKVFYQSGERLSSTHQFKVYTYSEIVIESSTDNQKS